MKAVRNLFQIGVGVLAGVAACQLMKKYNEKQSPENRYVDISLDEQPAAPQPAPRQQPAYAPQSAQEDLLWDLPTAADVFGDRGQSTGSLRNPVELGAAEKPPVVDGKVDATKIADPDDFADWDSFGCQG